MQFDEFFDARCTCFQIERVVFERSVSQQCFDFFDRKFQNSTFHEKTRETLFTFDFSRCFLWIFKQCGLLSSLSNIWVFLDEAKSRLWLSNMHAKYVEEDLHYRRIGLSTCGSPLLQPLKMRRRPPGNPCCKFPSFQKPSLQ